MNTAWLSEALVERLLAPLPVWGRCLGLVVGFPVFSQKGVPVQTKLGLSLLVTALVTPTLGPLPTPQTPVQRAALFAGELLLGLALAYVGRLLFTAVQVAGQFVEVPMGLGMAGAVDPASGGRIPLFGQFYYFLVGTVFLTVDGHLTVLKALADSFRHVPPGGSLLHEGAPHAVFWAFTETFNSGVAIAVPILIAVFVTDTALALANRAVPQLSIFSIGFPLKTAVGLLAAMAALPFMVRWAVSAFEAGGLLPAWLDGFIRVLR
ncbi:MAG: flagellar biosynthetic protein FliR [Limnochordia bacterium]|jgi:flagellar biosynthetic protein FliR